MDDDQQAWAGAASSAVPTAGTAQAPAGRACSACGQVPPSWRRSAVADLAIEWVVPDPARPGMARTAAFCRSCAPHGRVAELACSSCAEGPLVIGVTHVEDGLPAPVLSWLSARGWMVLYTRAHITLTCPACAAPARTTPARTTPVRTTPVRTTPLTPGLTGDMR